MTNRTILITDTDTDTIQKIMSTLESKDYLVFTASDRDISVQMAKKINPSLIFINIGMSGTSGLEICKAIHDTETLRNVPIVIITPHGGTVDSRYTSLYGIVDLLKKPFTPEELISKTKNVIAMKSVEAKPIEEVEVQPVEEKIAFKPFEKEKIEENKILMVWGKLLSPHLQRIVGELVRQRPTDKPSDVGARIQKFLAFRAVFESY